MRADTPILRLTASAALLAASAASFLPLLATDAQATQDYAKKEGKDCSFCHMNPKGAGPRTPQGREYEANGHVFGAKSWTSDALRDRYLRACAAVQSQWYAEAGVLLDALAKEEKLPGGLALVEGTRGRFKMFPNAWTTGAKKLLTKGDAGLPGAFAMLAKLETQFPGLAQGKEAKRQLDEAAKADATKRHAETARAVEKARLLLLEGKTEWTLGNEKRARTLLDQLVADPNGATFKKDAEELLAPVK